MKRESAPLPCYKGERPGFHYTNPDLFSDATEEAVKKNWPHSSKGEGSMWRGWMCQEVDHIL